MASSMAGATLMAWPAIVARLWPASPASILRLPENWPNGHIFGSLLRDLLLQMKDNFWQPLGHFFPSIVDSLELALLSIPPILLATFWGKRERRFRSMFPPINFSTKWGELFGSKSWSSWWFYLFFLSYFLTSICCFVGIWEWRVWALCSCPMH